MAESTIEFMMCVCTPPQLTPEERRHQVVLLVHKKSSAELALLRGRLYAEVPAEGLAEEQGREPKSRCVVCWEKRPNRLKWKEHQEHHRYTCGHRSCYRLWLRLTQAEERVRVQAQARLAADVLEGRTAA